MEDTDLMPFGKHKGTMMANVPDDYLWWMYENGSVPIRKIYPQVFEYIADNLDTIKPK